jgi:hypothetical protein
VPERGHVSHRRVEPRASGRLRLEPAARSTRASQAQPGRRRTSPRWSAGIVDLLRHRLRQGALMSVRRRRARVHAARPPPREHGRPARLRPTPGHGRPRLQVQARGGRRGRVRRAQLIFLGDLNSMGLDYVFGQRGGPGTALQRDRAIAEHEIARLAFEAGRAGSTAAGRRRIAPT